MLAKHYKLLLDLAKTSDTAKALFEKHFPLVPTEPNVHQIYFPTLFLFAYDGRFTAGSAYAPDNPFAAESFIFASLFTLKLIDAAPRNPDRSGRTDAGVSARRNAVRIDLLRQDKGVVKKLNCVLPPYVRILAAAPVPKPDFSLRFSAKSRIYVYKLGVENENQIQMLHNFCQSFVGTWDFSSLSNEERGRNCIRTILRSQCIKRDSQCEFWVCGVGFCRNQVRCMVGALLECLALKSDVIPLYLNGARAKQYQMASSYNLCFVECVYMPEICWKGDFEVSIGGQMWGNVSQEIWAQNTDEKLEKEDVM
ncbi:TRNA pseudouridine synthase [Spironucleus salmonicida]|uniref:tRNA pseudouridine synthase n=1 Tax=Spironucleus salmonicida TaxID=348837 RepID=V6M0D9_9EUKA|nr:TRNA pseudouridine synthase [Spironucleus salmonicida]|eukprot:EST46599.1 tRNA pseudouridine synthase [Spironucleus salmonicida]